MKKLILILILLTCISTLQAQVKFEALSFSPQFPKANDKVSFTYNANYSPLIKQKKVGIAIYLFNTVTWKVLEPTTVKNGNTYSGSFQLDSSTSAIVFAFTAKEEKDQNGGKGYIIPVYNTDNTATKGYYLTLANLNNGLGEDLFGLPTSVETALQNMEDAKRKYPQLTQDPKFLDQYWSRLSKLKKADANPVILEQLQQLTQHPDFTESDYNFMSVWYSRLKMKTASDSITAILKEKYPAGNWVKAEMMQPFSKEKDIDKKVALYNDLKTKYPEKDKSDYENYRAQIANAYATEKNYTKYHEWNKGISERRAASNNNNLAWSMAEKEENLQEAKAMALEAATYAKNEMLKPKDPKPGYVTTEQWIQQRKGTYAMYGDTYAYVLYKLGDYKTAFPVSKDAATINELKDAELNERYALIAEKVLPVADAKKLIEQFAKDGVATSKTKEALKRLYVQEKKSDNGFEDYIAALEATAKNKKREDITKSMLNDPSPKFSLKDFEGKTVSLDDLKGKVVIVDFWATWCGPCIASMPGMNKALTKYKDDENVKFLFIDTWESTDDKLKNAKDFMTKKNYPFYVLMDNDNKMVGDFKLSGIPTKFVIDKEGKVRFKSVGFEGSDDNLVDELTTMIEIAGK